MAGPLRTSRETLMPLIKSSSEKALRQNIAEMRRAGHPEKQSVAAAFHNQREAKAKGMARGGMGPIPGISSPAGLPGQPLGGGSGPAVHMHGLMPGSAGGRSDTLHLSVPRGGYVVPADVVSGTGHGNTMAGARALEHSFPMQSKDPMGRAHVHGFAPLMQRPFGSAFPQGKGRYATGGDTGPMTEIMGSSGEFFIHPAALARKFGSVKRGQKIMDHWVQMKRKQLIAEQKKLKPPKGAKKI